MSQLDQDINLTEATFLHPLLTIFLQYEARSHKAVKIPYNFERLNIFIIL